MKLPIGAQKALSRLSRFWMKHGNDILVVGGIAGMGLAAVAACEATTKVNGIKDKHEEMMHDALTIEDDKESRKAVAKVYFKTSMAYAKLYAKPVAGFALAAGSNYKGYRNVKNDSIRNAALAASMYESYKGYRDNVKEKYGEDVDKELLYGLKKKTITEEVTDEEGNKKKVKSKVNQHTKLLSPYTYIYQSGCNGWSKDPAKSKIYLAHVQRWANELAESRAKTAPDGIGYVWLDEVLDELNIIHSEVTRTVGWIFDFNNPIGDNFIDFGLTDSTDEKVGDFLNGVERNVLIEFNVDGDIRHLLTQRYDGVKEQTT